jgi:hypothetical protein
MVKGTYTMKSVIYKNNPQNLLLELMPLQNILKLSDG